MKIGKRKLEIKVKRDMEKLIERDMLDRTIMRKTNLTKKFSTTIVIYSPLSW